MDALQTELIEWAEQATKAIENLNKAVDNFTALINAINERLTKLENDNA